MFAPNPNPPPLLRNFFTASETVEEDLFGEVFLLSVFLNRRKDLLLRFHPTIVQGGERLSFKSRFDNL
jgi:hypothetical protein